MTHARCVIVYRDEVRYEDSTEDVGRHAAHCVDDENTQPAEHLLKPTHYHDLKKKRKQHVQDAV